MVGTKKIKTATGTNDQITDQIVREMWRLIKRDYKTTEIKEAALKLKKPSRLETIKQVFDFVRENYKYKADPPGIEHLTAPIHIIKNNYEYMDCDELVMISSALLMALGIPVLIKTIAWRKYAYTHVVLEAQLSDDRWIVFDATREDGFGNQERKVIREKRYK